MPLEFCLPAVAEAEAEGFIVNWFKDEGQSVNEGELLLEVQFEKVTTEVTAPQSGVVAKILTTQGMPVKVGQPLCLIAAAGEAAAPAPAASAPAAPAAEAAPPKEIRATPAAKRVARELGVTIADVPGTGPGGRIGEEDVKRFAAAKANAPTPAPAPAPPAAPAPAPTAPKITIAGQRKPLAPSQRITGERMMASLRDTAQFTLGREIEVTALVALRAKLKQMGSPVSLSDLIHRAVIQAVAQHPGMQAQLDGSDLVLPDAINLGIAVARGDELLVPVIKGAQNLSLPELAAERKRLTQAVKASKVSAIDLQGATFTISNLGSFGIDFFTPVINPPQPSILGIGRTVERLVMTDRAIRPAQFITFSFTIDHRVINGANGAQFLETLAQLLAAPEGWAFVD